MYHGKSVPGFPAHPHRGFETNTVVRNGFVDHSDSLGGAGRYGDGDVQWLTSGKGIQHPEMFPLIKHEEENVLELFQIWLNLPAKSKMVEPRHKMFWKESIPFLLHIDVHLNKTKIEVIAGELENVKAQTPPPDSWASDPKNKVAIWIIKMDAGATFTLPKTSEGINRTIYIFGGSQISIDGSTIEKEHAVELLSNNEITVASGTEETSILFLQGKPIGEPVAQYGPFVMNTNQEIKEAYDDYSKTQFGDWPWQKYDQVHPRENNRFAKFADGTSEVMNP
jgi:hypothetical protein